MNERNVEALRALISAFQCSGVDVQVAGSPTYIAGYIASKGALVSSAMSDDDCRAVSVRDADGAWEDYLAPAVREELERIAKGEAT